MLYLIGPWPPGGPAKATLKKVVAPRAELHWYEAHGIGKNAREAQAIPGPKMAGKKKAVRRFAVCVKNDGYEAALERSKLYVVLPDADAAKDGDVRVVDESGKEDYLYPTAWFMAVELPKAVVCPAP